MGRMKEVYIEAQEQLAEELGRKPTHAEVVERGNSIIASRAKAIGPAKIFSVQYAKDDIVHKVMVESDCANKVMEWAKTKFGNSSGPYLIKQASTEDHSTKAFFNHDVVKL